MRVVTPSEVRDFWLSDATRKKWFVKDPDFDREIVERFGETYEAARRGDLAQWMDRPEDAVALLIVLDQFSRNMFRGSPRAFESDGMAQGYARAALGRGYDREMDADTREIFYRVFTHSEALADQELGVALFTELGDAGSLRFAIAHRDIIARFGRFPHRNAVLGRETTPEEAEFLKTHAGF